MIKKISCLIIIMSIQIFSAAFNATDSIINVPIAKQYKAHEIEIGMSHAYNGSPAIQSTDIRYDLDFKTVYSLDESNQIAINLVNPSVLTAHFQHTITSRFSNNQDNQIAIGLRNINQDPYSTWEQGDEYVEEINMSPYIVNTFYTEKTLFSIGLGARAFQHTTKTIDGIGSFLENLNGVFFGFQYTENFAKFCAEYDGKDINFGVKFQISDTFELSLGLTEQFISGDYNDQHSGGPRRQLTFGLSSKNLFSPTNYYNNKIKELNQTITEYEKKELKRLENERKKKEIELISDDQVLKLKVAELYIHSLEKYNNREYDEAIHLLHEALEIDEHNYLILSRLGSYYYTYGFLDHASYYWKEALKINPESKKLHEIKEFVNNY